MEKRSLKSGYQLGFYIAMTLWIIVILLGEVFLPSEMESIQMSAGNWPGTWELVAEDGTRSPAVMPGKNDVPSGQSMVVESVVPLTATDGMAAVIRASQQSAYFYIDGELRSVYDTKDERLFGKNSMSRFVFCQLTEADAGKTIRLVLTSDSIYSGQLNQMIYGSEAGVVSKILKENFVEVVTAVFILFMGVFGIAFCIVIRAGRGKEVPLFYLCLCLILASLWILSEAQLRQFLFPNTSLIGVNAFYMIIFTPFAAAMYLDSLQEGRYHELYRLVEGGFLIDFALVTVLQVLGIMDLLESMYITHSITVIAGFIAIGAMINDLRTGKIKRYRYAAIGLLVFLLCGMLEIGMTYVTTFLGTGVMLSIGLVLLLIFSVITTAQNVFEEDRDKQRAVLAGEAKSEFLTRMSHEIRTPINSILGMNEMILRENQDESIGEYATNVARAGQMLLSLVNDILDLSKIESGKLELIEKPYPLGTLFQDLRNMFEDRVRVKGLNFEYEIDPSLPMELVGDEIRLKQIVANLLSNAVKYTKRGFVSLKAGGYLDEKGLYVLRISVGDSGQGIKEEDMDMLFQRFTRLEEKKNEAIEGTGLGLNIVKELVSLMKGRVEVNSQYGVGTEFVVEIPQEVFDNTPIGDIENYHSVKTTEGFHERLVAKNVKVLSVDDNEMNHAVLIALLKYTGIQVDVAGSGEECLEKCAKRRYDLIFMDHMMPVMDGIETLHHLRKGNGKNVDTKVVALTANAIPGMREMYLEEGFADYLTKPLEYDQLEKTLLAHLKVGKIAISERKSETTVAAGAQSGALEEDQTAIDTKVGLSYCANDQDFYLEMLQMYMSQSIGHRKELAQYFLAKDWGNYAIKVHTIKSTSKSIGAMGMFERAKEHELHAKDGDVAFIEGDYDSFLALYEKVLENVAKVVSNRGK